MKFEFRHFDLKIGLKCIDPSVRGVGRSKSWGGQALRSTFRLKRAPKKFFLEMLATGEKSSQKNFPDIPKKFSGHITFFPENDKKFPDVLKNFPEISYFFPKITKFFRTYQNFTRK